MAEKSTSDSAGEGGIISWILGLLSGGNDPEREKKRLLKQIGKDLTRIRYKFYRPRGNQALPGLGKLFFDTYKITASAASLLQNAANSKALREFCIDAYMTDQQKSLAESFDEGHIREAAKTMDPKMHAAKLKDNMVSFFSSFDSNVVSEIDSTYSQILRLIEFVNFDYYFVLKKFDASLSEGNITSSPKFEAINGDYVSDDIKDFMEVLLTLDLDADWDRALDVLSKYKGVEVINRQAWSKLMNGYKNVLNSKVLDMIVQHIDEDPYWKPVFEITKIRIVEGYLDQLKTRTENIVQKILTEKRNAKVDKLCQMVFGSTPTPRMKHYTEKANMMFGKKLNIDYRYTGPMNYLKTFLLDFFKKDIRDLQDLLLVRGKWSTNVMSQQMSDAYYRVLEMSEALLKFDEDLSDDGDLGGRIKRALSRVIDRDPSSARGAQALIVEANDGAMAIINETAGNLISFGKNIKSLLEDVERKDHQLIINWKELEAMTDIPLKDRMADAYKKIYYFIQLLQMFVKPGRKAEPEAPV